MSEEKKHYRVEVTGGVVATVGPCRVENTKHEGKR
jgi:hypothetical protein